MDIEKIEWESKPFGASSYGEATMSKCGKYIKGWEWCDPKDRNCGYAAFFTIDVVKGIKTGGSSTEQIK